MISQWSRALTIFAITSWFVIIKDFKILIFFSQPRNFHSWIKPVVVSKCKIWYQSLYLECGFVLKGKGSNTCCERLSNNQPLYIDRDRTKQATIATIVGENFVNRKADLGSWRGLIVARVLCFVIRAALVQRNIREDQLDPIGIREPWNDSQRRCQQGTAIPRIEKQFGINSSTGR